MKRNRIQNIIIHVPDSMNFHALASRVSLFHSEIIQRKLNQSNLTAEQKITVLNRIIENLRSREVNGFIK